MEIIKAEQYPEFEEFVSRHSQGGFTQSPRWRLVKNNWGWEGIVSRAPDGSVKGACGVLVQQIPALHTSFLYAPRGPVCDPHDTETLRDLKEGADALAGRYHAHTFKWDPDVFASDEGFLSAMRELGFSRLAGPTGFETIQCRFNYRLYLQGRSEEALFMNLTQKTRYNVRLARKKGVEIRVVEKEERPALMDDFMRIMRTTGERDGFSTRPKEYFERMLDALGENVRLYMAFYEGQPISGAITTNYAGKTCYVYGASDNVYRNVMPNYLIQWEMIRWAIETGCTVYDFQGVSGVLDEEDHLYGLYRFKRGFNGQLDELAGEFDYVYHPAVKAMVDKAIEARSAAVKLKNKLTEKKD
ncbi:MAG: peptidoglycan bridge formation glycyltransferase FemA/FemB family protein [Clostridiales bacterium]|uniref:lipid II:glycine glycyltransferase FemX n=1 Tax=Provencibacterium massiliense TaxID=1841868 RepID=UPI0009A6F0C1|nr:peptidoglycan bridge formation glycyltransferase FemA/FemB family protein [Provencibacterium massiliense]PWM36926.1 MAG: peptidoglycan bridge formation glycyltransferase FemA/FemB family protein [Clostridiales bacterium]RGB68988.1 peptidoglycan bridge formation glycyltransferase FemA/FemB family protein [Harryflintia acetispora]